jgi:uncharacterized protein
MPVVTPTLALIIFVAGTIAGVLGALLGLGGGIFLVPFLNLALKFPISAAAAISLTTVIATSSSVSAARTGKQLINMRLGMVLEVATAAGSLLGGVTAHMLAQTTIQKLFSAATAVVAVIMLSRLQRRNVLDASVDPGLLGGRFHEDESGGTVSYRVKRLPVAIGASFIAGNLSSLLGIGGGFIKVPVLNAWCGVPMRAAAATSALMIGVTAVATVPLHYANGYVHPPLAAAAVLGVLAGSRIGFWQAGRVRAQWLKLLMAGVLAAVSITYLVKAL